MSDIPWNKIMQGTTFGYSYCKTLQDERGIPIDYVFLDVNPAFASMIGKTRDEIVDRRVTDLIEDIERDTFDWIDFFGRVAITGEKAEFEEYSKPLDRWFHLSVMSPERGYFCVLSFDITDKRKAEFSLILSEERNRRYLNSAPDGIFIADESGRYVQTNPAAEAMLGYGANELEQRTIADVVPPELANAARAGFLELKRTGRQTRKTILQKKTGARITVLLDAVALPEGQYMAFCKDITEQEKLAREKERYYIAFQSMTQPIIFTDPRGLILEINAAFAGMYGYSRDETIGKTPKLLNPGKDVYMNLGYTEEEYDGLFAELWDSVRDPARGSWEGIVINRKKSGTLAWVNLIVTAIFDPDGNITSIIGLPIDITTSREMEDKNRVQLYQTIAELAELRDNETGNHMKRVGIFARLVAKACGMNEKFCSDIELFAPMHDIGKVGILDSILRAPRKLSAEEFEIMKNHTVLGHNIVKDKAGCEMAAEVTLSHHEKYDGTGYPQRLQGKDIPLAAHITALADVYDALRSPRPYKESWEHQTTVDYLVKSAGSHFDPDLIDVFITLESKFATVYDELKD